MTKTADTACVTIFIAGDLGQIKEACRVECECDGWCLTVTPTTFIYTGGEETGAAIGIINYARFPAAADQIEARALRFAEHLLKVLHQKSCSVVGQSTTHYLTREISAARTA